ncbi:hypothetical protein GCM10017744_010020 [Streptomyces antimycoticus]
MDVGGDDGAAAGGAGNRRQVGEDAELAVDDVQIEVADGGRLHPHQGVAGPWLGDRPLDEPRQGAELLQHQGL